MIHRTLYRLRTCTAVISALLPAACTTPSMPVSGDPVNTPVTAQKFRLFTEKKDDSRQPRTVRAALLLPFSAEDENVRKTAASMFDAAQMAVFDSGNTRLLLLPKDTQGTAGGSAAAAEEALAEGAAIILGPLFSGSVRAVARIARPAGVPVIAFSSDIRAGGKGVYLLSFPPETEVRRITDYAMSRNMTRFGLLAPAGEYGARVAGTFSRRIAEKNGVLVHQEPYFREPDAMLEPARRLAGYAHGMPGHSPARDDAGTDSHDPDDTRSQEGFQAVLLPESGVLLRALAPLLPYYDVDIKNVKLLGLSSWNDPRLTREPALRGGWFSAPDPESTRNFEDRYTEKFGSFPERLASLGYDATLLAAYLVRKNGYDDPFSPDAITDPSGYSGADGLFRFHPDGSIERGLAILEIRPEGIETVDPAPRTFYIPPADGSGRQSPPQP